MDVVARQVAREGQPVGDRDVAGDVLQAVHREVGLVGEQRMVDLLDEGALAAELGQIAHPPVASGGDLDQLGAQGRVECFQGGGDLLSLVHSHRTGAGGDPDRARHSGEPYDSAAGGEDQPAGPVHQCDLEAADVEEAQQVGAAVELAGSVMRRRTQSTGCGE